MADLTLNLDVYHIRSESDGKMLFRKRLTENVEEIINLNSQYMTILNVGAGNVYVNFNQEATTDSLLIPEGMGRSFHFATRINEVHIISEDTPIIQIDDLR